MKSTLHFLFLALSLVATTSSNAQTLLYEYLEQLNQASSPGVAPGVAPGVQAVQGSSKSKYYEYKLDNLIGAYNPNQLVVKFPLNVLQDDRDLLLAIANQIAPTVVVERCGCGTIETWQFEGGNATKMQEEIRGASTPIRGQSEGDSILVSLNYYYGNISNMTPQVYSTYESAIKRIPQGNEKDMKVGQLDTGLDFAHDGLYQYVWNNPTENFWNETDNNDNCYVSDALGWNFIGNNNNVWDDSRTGHGTHVAGIMVQNVATIPSSLITRQANGDGPNTGETTEEMAAMLDLPAIVEPNTGKTTKMAAMLDLPAIVEPTNPKDPAKPNFPLKIQSAKVLDENGVGMESHLACGIRYLTDEDVKVINASLGRQGEPSEVVQDAINYAEKHCVPMVFSAGNIASNNDKYPNWPSNCKNSNIIAVNALNENHDALWEYSNLASKPVSVDIAAFGENILSTVPGGGYATKSGTSMAAPMVTAGVAVLLATTRGRKTECSSIPKAIVEYNTPIKGLPNAVHGFFSMEQLIGFSPIELVEDLEPPIKIKLVPNPVVSTTTASFSVAQEGKAILILMDAYGLVRQEISLDLKEGENQIELDLEKLESGVYKLYVYQYQGEGKEELGSAIVIKM